MTISFTRSLLVVAAAAVLAMLFAACGDGATSKSATPAPSVTCVAGGACGVAGGVLATAVSTRVVVPGATSGGGGGALPADTAVPPTAPASAPTATPEIADQTGETGIVGRVTIGPSCPVQRVDSPCPDRPYEARLTLWRNGDKIAETRSDADGRFRIIVAPGDYLLVGESAGTLPRGTQQAVTVEDGRLTQVQVQYDSGIR